MTNEPDRSIREYIAAFKAADNDSDNSLDFLPSHEYYKVFANLRQKAKRGSRGYQKSGGKK